MATSKGFVGVLAASSLFTTSTAAASTNTAAARPVSPWATLTFLSGGAPTAALCGGTALVGAAQSANGCVLPALDAAPPPPTPGPEPVQPVPAAGGYGIMPLLLGLAALAAGIGFLFLVDDNHHHGAPGSPG